jgi:hypothetical protein
LLPRVRLGVSTADNRQAEAVEDDRRPSRLAGEAECCRGRCLTWLRPTGDLPSIVPKRMFDKVTWTSLLTEARLNSLYDADGFGGEKTMRARVVRELIDEIRALRCYVAETDRPPAETCEQDTP